MGAEKDPKKKDSDLHRLSDIQTKEVSIVDRAANKRRFLVVKRDEEGQPDMTTKNAGETKPVAKADATTVTEGATQGTAIVPPPAGTPGADPALYAAGSVTIGNGAPPELNTAPVIPVNQDFTGTPVTSFPSVEPQIPEAAELEAAMKSLSSVQKNLVDLRKIEDPAVINKKLDEMTTYVTKSIEAITTEIRKKGAKMAQARLEAMGKALETFNKLYKELGGMGFESNPGDPGARKEPQGKPPAEGVAKNEPAATTTPIAKSAPSELPPELKVTLDSMNATLQKLAEGLGGVTRVVKRQGEIITKVTKNAGGGNSLEPDGDGASPAVEDVDWPMDLNATPDRETLRKRGTSFMPNS